MSPNQPRSSPTHTPEPSWSRRSGVVIGTGALSALLLSACGGGDGDSSGEGETLSVWIMEGTNPDASDFFSDVEEAFEEETGATLDIEFVPWGAAHDQFVNAIAGGTTPDVAEVGTTWTPEFADAGALADLSDLVSEDTREGYEENLMESGTYDDAVYGVPWYAGVRAFLYRTDVFEEAGLEEPTTWDEIIEVGEGLKEHDPDTIPFPVPAAQHMVTPFIWGAGGEVATGEGDSWTSGLDSPEAEEGIQFYADLAVEHDLSTPTASTWDEADVQDAFAQGDTPMIINGSWTPDTIIDANPDLEGNIGAFPIPGPDGGLSPSFLGGSHMNVFETAENPELAWEFVEMMTTGEFAQRWGEESGYFPATTELLDDLQESEDPLVAPFAEQMNEAGASMPVTPEWGQVEGAQILPSMLQSVLGDSEDVDSAAQDAADEMNEIFGQ
jgi:N,N'-diacetylchitobiose transport system substrate-binding protein